MARNKKGNLSIPPLLTAREDRGGKWSNQRHVYAIKAQSLRRNSTDAEKLLWQKIRNRQLSGYKFKRQFPIGPYAADFVCIEKMLIIEVDGGQHNEDEKDKIRTTYLQKRGYEVIRFWNNDILKNIEGVVDTLSRKLQSPFSRSAGEGWDEGVAQQERLSTLPTASATLTQPLPQSGRGD